MTRSGRLPRVKLDGQPPIHRPVTTSRGNISPNSWANITNAIVDAMNVIVEALPCVGM
jgi:hypothetical protein